MIAKQLSAKGEMKKLEESNYSREPTEANHRCDGL